MNNNNNEHSENYMVFDGEPLTDMLLPEKCICEHVIFDHIWSYCDLLTSKSNQFTFVPNCT